MRGIIKIVVVVALCMSLAAQFAGAVSAQGYLDDPPNRFLVAEGQADFDGKFDRKFTAPEFISEPFHLYVVGTDEDGEPFEWIVFIVTPPYAGLTWSVRGANMLPGSDYVLEARYADGTAFTEEEIVEARAAALEAPAEEDAAEAEADEAPADDAAADTEDAADDTADAVEVQGTTQFPEDDDSSNLLLPLGGAVALAVLGGAGVYAARMRSRY